MSEINNPKSPGSLSTSAVSTISTIQQFMLSLPRPVQAFIGLALVCLLIKGVRSANGGSARSIADAAGTGLLSVLREQPHRDMTLFSTADMANNAHTVEIKNFGVGLLGTIFSGGVQRAGGNAYFHHYADSGVQIDGGPLDLQIPGGKTDIQGVAKGKMLIEGTLSVDGQSVPVRLVFWLTDDDVGLIMGAVIIDGRTKYLKGDEYDLFHNERKSE